MKESLLIQQQLRELLSRFYDGDTTPEEEREIQRMLNMPQCRTDEFAADRKLFAAMEAIAATDIAEMQPEAPASLGDMLDEMTDRHYAAARKNIWLRWLTVAAAAACIAVIAFTIPYGGDNDAQMQPPLMAEVHTPLAPTAEEQAAVEPLPSTQDEPQPEHRHATPVRKARRAVKVTSTPAPTATDDYLYADGTTYLSPEEAARVSEAALMTVARTLASTDGVYRQADERINTSVSTTLLRLNTEINEPENKI